MQSLKQPLLLQESKEFIMNLRITDNSYHRFQLSLPKGRANINQYYSASPIKHILNSQVLS